jgi:hypothetical protein
MLTILGWLCLLFALSSASPENVPPNESVVPYLDNTTWKGGAVVACFADPLPPPPHIPPIFVYILELGVLVVLAFCLRYKLIMRSASSGTYELSPASKV